MPISQNQAAEAHEAATICSQYTALSQADADINLPVPNTGYWVRVKIEYQLAKNKAIVVFSSNDVLEDHALLNDIGNYLQAVAPVIELPNLENRLKGAIPQGCHVIFTGFSLGGAAAEIAACYVNRIHNQVISAITFESPGTQMIVSNRANTIPRYANAHNTPIEGYVTVPNQVNTHAGHIGTLRRLRLRHVAQTSWTHWGKAAWGSADRAMTYAMPVYAGYTWFVKGAATAASAQAASTVVEKAATHTTTAAAASGAKEAHIAYKVSGDQVKRWFSHGFWKHERKFRAAAEKATQAAQGTKTALDVAKTEAHVAQAAAQVASQACNQTIGGTVLQNMARQVSLGTRTQLVDVGQHSLGRMINGFNDRRLRASVPTTAQGHVFTVTQWPTSLGQSWGTFFTNMGRSYVPFQAYNAGLHNINDEDGHIEATLEIKEGYRAIP